MDVWNQVHPYAFWNNQTGNSELLRPPLVREGRRFFDGVITMSNYYYDHNYKILLPQWERIQDELSIEDNEKECQKANVLKRDLR